jgi:hypothetical protein
VTGFGCFLALVLALLLWAVIAIAIVTLLQAAGIRMP